MQYRILIVDDEDAFQLLLDTALKRAGYLTHTVSDASAALQVLRQTRVDAIILDDMMPGMSGSDLCVMLKKDPVLRNIPVILYTGGVRYGIEELLHRSHADLAMIKNGKMNELMGALKQLLIAAV